jgi:hypothetical protein
MNLDLSSSGIPRLTLDAAFIAAYVGLCGLLLAWWRAACLYIAVARLNRAHQDWGTITTLRATKAFRKAMSRLVRFRDNVGGEPEEAWRASFELMMSDEERWEGSIRSLSAVAVLVGLTGTIMGFLQLGAGPGNVSQLPKLFFATIFGVGGSLAILLLGLPPLRSAIASWANTVEDVGRLVLLPALPRPPTRLPEAIENAILTQLTVRLEAIAKVWHDSLAGPASSLESLVSSASASIQEIQRALESVKISADDLKDFAASARQIKTASSAMANSSVVYGSAATELISAATSFRQTMAGLSEAVRDGTARLGLVEQAVTLATGELSSQGQNAIKGMSEMATNFSGLTNVVTDRMRQESGVAQDARDAVTAVNGHLSSLRQVEEALTRNADRMSLAAGALKDAADNTLRELPTKVSETVTDSLRRIEHQQQLLFDEAKDQLVRAGDRSAGATDRFAESSGRIATAVEGFATHGQAISRSVDVAANKMNSIKDDLSVATSRFTEVTDQNLAKIPDRLDTALREMLRSWQSEQEQNLSSLAQEMIQAVRVSSEASRELRDAACILSRNSRFVGDFGVPPKAGREAVNERVTPRDLQIPTVDSVTDNGDLITAGKGPPQIDEPAYHRPEGEHTPDRLYREQIAKRENEEQENISVQGSSHTTVDDPDQSSVSKGRPPLRDDITSSGSNQPEGQPTASAGQRFLRLLRRRSAKGRN